MHEYFVMKYGFYFLWQKKKKNIETSEVIYSSKKMVVYREIKHKSYEGQFT